MENFKRTTEDGVAILTWDMPDRSMNVLNDGSIRELKEAVADAAQDGDVKGIIITSGKDAFCAGADLEMLNALTAETPLFDDATLQQRQAMFDNCLALNETYRGIEQCGKPVVAALPGTAVGGGCGGQSQRGDKPGGKGRQLWVERRGGRPLP